MTWAGYCVVEAQTDSLDLTRTHRAQTNRYLRYIFLTRENKQLTSLLIFNRPSKGVKRFGIGSDLLPLIHE